MATVTVRRKLSASSGACCLSRVTEAVRAGRIWSARAAVVLPVRPLGALASTWPTRPVAEVRAMEPLVAALWAEPAAPAADIR
jgi:hypothetical protein